MSKPTPNPAPQAAAPKKHLIDDDTIVVPKGTSRLRFLILLGLTIITLVIFVVGNELEQTFNRRQASGADVTWDGPLVGKRQFSPIEFRNEKLREDQYLSAFGQRNTKFEDDTLASELLLDEIAKQCGIEVSVKDLEKAIYEGYPGVVPPMNSFDIYKMVLQRSGVSAPLFESVLTRKLRIARYEEFLREAAMVADPSQMDAEWKKLHPEFAYDLISVEHAQFTDAAKAEQPDAAGMKAWYDALAEPAKRSMFLGEFLPATVSAELIAYRCGGGDSAEGLLAKFPLPADLDKEQVAKDYYNQYSSTRFVRETPLPEDLTDAAGTNRLINSFDEVAEIARKESLVLHAFRSWVADVKARKAAGTAVDLAAEAQALNLFHRPADGAKTDAEWRVLPEVGGPFMAQAVAGTPKDDFGADVSVDRSAMTFPRVLEKYPQAAPPYEKVAEKALSEWLKQKTQELAVAKLTLVRDALPKQEAADPAKPVDPAKPEPVKNPKADEAQFKAAAEAQGLTVERRDWMSSIQQNNDPDASKPAHEFIRFNGFLRNLPADEVGAVQQDRLRVRSYLVRSLGQREPPEAKLLPSDVKTIQASLESKHFQEFYEANLSVKALAERYKLRVRGSKEIPEPGT